MLISNEDASRRLSSPLNLLNRLSQAVQSSRGPERRKAMSLFVKPNIDNQEEKPDITSNPPIIFNPSSIFPPQSNQNLPAALPPGKALEARATIPTIDSLLDNVDSKLHLEQAHNKALEIVNQSLDSLKQRLSEVNKPEKLIDVAAKASKIVNDIRSERDKGKRDREVHLHFYTPEQKPVESYEVIDV